MSSQDWIQRAAAISPLLACAEPGAWGGERGIVERIFGLVPAQAGFAVEFGQRSMSAGTLAGYVRQSGWGALYMDREAVSPLEVRSLPGGRSITLARESVAPGNINALFEKHRVPADLDCLVIDIDGIDYWVWEAIDAKYRPSLVIIEFNAHVPTDIEATIRADEGWVYRPSKNYGASFSALCGLAERKGYRLIHVHGAWNLYFLRKDLAFPDELAVKRTLSGPELALLTDTEAFYEALCGAGRRPTWFGAEAPDVAQEPWEILAPAQATKTVDLDGLALEVLADKHDPTWYLQRRAFEEKASLLYRFLHDEGFENLVDVGANVGFVSIVARRAAPALRVIAIEADPRLARLIRRNFLTHGLEEATVVNAIVGASEAASAFFSLNPSSTLDNRVSMAAWPKVHVPVVTVDALLSRLYAKGKTFFKLDTQGYELHVLKGLEATLAAMDGWTLKMEFAPNWLRSQGTDPAALLDHLQQRYEFAEYPERIAFGTPDLDALFTRPLQADRHAAFLEHVVGLDKKGLGWVDLIVRAKQG